MHFEISIILKYIKLSITILSIVILSLPGYISAQETKKNLWYIEPAVRYGRVLPNFKEASWLWQTDLCSVDLRIGRQTDGQKEWEQWFHYPSYGLQLRYSHFNRESIGDKYAVFGFLNGYFVQRPKFAFFYQLGAGINFWTKKYDYYNNSENIFVGGHVSAHIDLALGISARISPHTDLTLRGDFSHSSNGVLAMPNYGINGLTAEVGLRCRFYEQLDLQYTIDTITQFRPINRLYVSVSPGTKQSRSEWAKSDRTAPHLLKHYFATTLEIGYLRQPHPKFRYGGGLDLFYNREILTYFKPEERKEGLCFMPAAFATFDLTFSRLVLHTSAGFYLGRYYSFYEPFYERVGVQFLLGKQKNHLLGVNIKAHLFVADYIEWTYGYSFFNWYDKKPRARKKFRS